VLGLDTSRGIRVSQSTRLQRRHIVRGVGEHQPGQPDHAGEHDSIPDPAQRAAFRALRRSRIAAHDTLPEPVALAIGPRLDAGLAWCVYSGPEGQAYIVAGPGSICFIATSDAIGTIRGDLPTAFAADAGHGFVHSGRGRPVTFVGVLPTGGHGVHVIDRSARRIDAVPNADDGYWLEVTDPVDFIKTRPDGTTQQIPFSNSNGNEAPHD
jgi:hypothetical protein